MKHISRVTSVHFPDHNFGHPVLVKVVSNVVLRVFSYVSNMTTYPSIVSTESVGCEILQGAHRLQQKLSPHRRSIPSRRAVGPFSPMSRVLRNEPQRKID
jgi:hypothetical protein